MAASPFWPKIGDGTMAEISLRNTCVSHKPSLTSARSLTNDGNRNMKTFPRAENKPQAVRIRDGILRWWGDGRKLLGNSDTDRQMMHITTGFD